MDYILDKKLDKKLLNMMNSEAIIKTRSQKYIEAQINVNYKFLII